VAHLRDADYVNGCVPHELNDRNLQQCLNAYDLLLEKNKEHPFLKKMIIRNEKSGLSTIT